MTLVSIIVPVYNTREYLAECIDSILSQTYKNLQIILVDDGSTDGSGKICDEYSLKDSRILAIHQENSGVSAARNTGLDYVLGDYVAFFDSDDIVLPKMVEELLYVAKEFNSDIVQSTGPLRSNFVDSGKIFHLNRDEVLDHDYSFDDFFKPSLWLGLYKFSVLKNVRFPQSIHFYEDFAVLTILASKCSLISFIDNHYYVYRNREGSANHSGMNAKRWSALLIPSFLEKEGVYRNYKDISNVTSFFVLSTLVVLLKSKERNFYYEHQIRKIILSNIFKIVNANVPKLRIRFCAVLYLVFPSIVRRIVRYTLTNANDEK